MDELNKRMIEVMVRLDLSKSAFAAALDVSLPLITHITSGRNKPGLDIIQKILSKFETINPDWLLLGNGTIYREKPKQQDYTAIYQRLLSIETALTHAESTNITIKSYHKLLMDEVLHLNEMDKMVEESSTNMEQIHIELNAIKQQLKSE
jgi:transcriptional regulator with XRE-family HTH domain